MSVKPLSALSPETLGRPYAGNNIPSIGSNGTLLAVSYDTRSRKKNQPLKSSQCVLWQVFHRL